MVWYALRSVQVPPNVQVFELAAAAIASRALWAAAELGVADHLDRDARPVDDLAAATGAHPGALYRVLRLLAAQGIFREHDGRRFSQTDMSVTLRSDHPTRTRAAVRMIGSEPMWQGFGAMRSVVATGRTGWLEAIKEPLFDWMVKHPEEASLFNDAMVGIHGGEVPAVAAAYPFAGTVVDIGGGSGNMLVHILRQHPNTTGVLFDLPHAAEEGRRRLKAEGLESRSRVDPGSFFDALTKGGDAYILSHIIHDWDEERCIRILENCRAAKNPGGKVLIVEMVVPPPNDPHPAKMIDIVMLAIAGGQERTEEEYRTLLSKAGLTLLRVIPTASPVSIVEAT
jgi:O-methyltransferase domain